MFVGGVVAWVTNPQAFTKNRISVGRNNYTDFSEVPEDRLEDQEDEPDNFRTDLPVFAVQPRDDRSSISSRSEVTKDQVQDIQIESRTQTLDTFRSIESTYNVRGQLVLVTEGDKKTLRFENFNVSNGPDLFVTLNQSSNPRSGNLGSHITLSGLKRTSGIQEYDVSNIDLSNYQTLTIYCRQFSRVFAVADL